MSSPNDDERWAKVVMDGNDFSGIPPRRMKRVIARLEATKAGLIKEGNYLKAQTYQDKINMLKEVYAEDTFHSRTQSRCSELMEHLSSAQVSRETATSRCEGVTEEFHAETERLRAELEVTLDEELAEFDEVAAGPPPPKFRRYSPGFLNLKRREAAMVSSKRYVEANALRQEVDREEKRELKEQIRSWRSFCVTQRQILVGRHQEQVRILMERRQAEWTGLNKSAIADARKHENKVRVASLRLGHAELSVMEEVATRGTSRAASRMTTSRRSSSSRRGNLPPIPVSPLHEGQLRERAAYVRTHNYNKKRKQEIVSHLRRSREE